MNWNSLKIINAHAETASQTENIRRLFGDYKKKYSHLSLITNWMSSARTHYTRTWTHIEITWRIRDREREEERQNKQTNRNSVNHSLGATTSNWCFVCIRCSACDFTSWKLAPAYGFSAMNVYYDVWVCAAFQYSSIRLCVRVFRALGSVSIHISVRIHYAHWINCFCEIFCA